NYYYRIVGVNSLGTPSAPSNAANAVSDNTLPTAVQITYAPTGRVDAASGRVAVGRVDVTVKVSEPLLSTPFLSIAPPNGVPIAVTVNFALSEAVKSGTTPQLAYTLSRSSLSPIAIATPTQTGPLAWQATFTLPANAGADVETLQFAFSAADDLDNIGTTI